MIDPIEEFLSESSPDSLPWVRKRDSSVVAFDTGKLASSIYAAFEQLEAEDAAFRAQELTRAVLHFLAESFESQIPTTEEISETTVKVLREVGQGPAARAYYDFRCRRQNLRQEMDILQAKEAEPEDAGEKPEDLDRLRSWDKSKVASALVEELDLDAVTARDIATAVEKKLLLLNLERISAGLIRELINCELLDRGLRRLLERRRLLHVSSSRLHQLLAGPDSLRKLHYRVGGEVLGQFALQEVFSRDVAGLHSEGLLHLYDIASPCHWPALSADLPALAMRSADEACMLQQFEENLHRDAARVAGTLALEAMDSVFALSASPAADASEVAEKAFAVVRRLLRVYPIRMVVNLYGRVPEFVANWLSEGPLFQVRPTELQDRFAHTFAEAFTARVMTEPEVAQRCRIEFHPDLDSHDDDFLLIVKPWARWALATPNVCVCFDRREIELTEGLRWNPLGRSGVYQYVGVNLVTLHEKLGGTKDDESLMQRLAIVCDSAVRAGIQKREFLRRQQPDLFAGRDHQQATMVLVPLGLDQLVQQMLAARLGEDPAATDFAVQLLRKMQQRVDREGKHYQLSCRIDGYPNIGIGEVGRRELWESAGLTTLSSEACSKDSLVAAGKLHQATGGGTAVCRLAQMDSTLDVVLELLAFARQRSNVRRLRLQMPVEARQRELFDVKT